MTRFQRSDQTLAACPAYNNPACLPTNSTLIPGPAKPTDRDPHVQVGPGQTFEIEVSMATTTTTPATATAATPPTHYHHHSSDNCRSKSQPRPASPAHIGPPPATTQWTTGHPNSIFYFVVVSGADEDYIDYHTEELLDDYVNSAPERY